MAHTFVSSYFHCVFSTKERQRLITPELRERLWPFIGGIAGNNGMKALTVGGVEDHVHILLSMPPTLSIAKAMQLIKGASSRWVNESVPQERRFEWQEGYGAFSVGVSQIEVTRRYIENQAHHHQKTGFQDEFRQFLQKHGIEYDERYIWG